MKGFRRRIALWPQYGPQSPCHHAPPSVYGMHPEPHAELKQPREQAGRRQADHQRLQDAELRMRLHDPNQPQSPSRRA